MFSANQLGNAFVSARGPSRAMNSSLSASCNVVWPIHTLCSATVFAVTIRSISNPGSKCKRRARFVPA